MNHPESCAVAQEFMSNPLVESWQFAQAIRTHAREGCAWCLFVVEHARAREARVVEAL